MPEIDDKPKRNRPPHPFSAADRVGQLARIACNYCRSAHYYRPRDLIHVVGDVSIYHMEGRMRCERCHRTDYMTAKLVLPTAAERQAMKIRPLRRIVYVRRVIWGPDEPA